MPQYNAKRIFHKFFGTQQTFTDTVGDWQNIVAVCTDDSSKNATIQFLDTGTYIIFRGKLLPGSHSANGHIFTISLPSKYTGIAFLGETRLQQLDSFTARSMTISGNVITTGIVSTEADMSALVISHKI